MSAASTVVRETAERPSDPVRRRPAVRGLIRSGWRALTRPLTVAQVLTSAAGAGGMLIGAWAMVPEQFRVFALLTLTANLLTGLFRSALFQPALMNQRTARHSYVVLRHALVVGLISAVLTGSVALAIGIRGGVSLALVAGTATVPVLYDWLRFRAIGLDRRWDLAGGDLARLVLSASVLFFPVICQDAVLLQSFLSSVMLVPLVFLAARVPHVSTWQPYRSYARSARWQLVDYLFSSSLNSIPLLVLGGAGALLVSAMRLAQSLLGPLTLAFAAAASNLVADGSTQSAYASDLAVVRRGSKLARQLALLAVACVVCLVTAVHFSGFELKGVDNDDLSLALLLTGASLASVAWSNMHAIVLRILGHQARVTVGRAIIAVLTLVGFVVGYQVDGVTASVVGGFLVLTLAGPLVLVSIARRTYHRAGLT